MMSNRNQDDCDTERLTHTSMHELTVPKFPTPNFESFMDNFKSAISCMDGIHGVLIDFLIREVDGNYNDNWRSKR